MALRSENGRCDYLTARISEVRSYSEKGSVDFRLKALD